MSSVEMLEWLHDYGVWVLSDAGIGGALSSNVGNIASYSSSQLYDVNVRLFPRAEKGFLSWLKNEGHLLFYVEQDVADKCSSRTISHIDYTVLNIQHNHHPESTAISSNALLATYNPPMAMAPIPQSLSSTPP
jgi:hypothetical protein